MSVGRLIRRFFHRAPRRRGAIRRLRAEPLESRLLLAALQLNPIDDNTLYEENGGNSNGLGEFLFVGNTSSTDARRAVLKFDVASYLPAGTIITGATLTLNMNDTQAGDENLELHRLTSNWGEGTSDAPGTEDVGAAATANDATWTYNLFGASAWTAAGGDFVALSSATTAVGGAGGYAWSTGNMLADIQYWINNPTLDFGWTLVGNESASQTLKRFNSNDNADAGSRPILEITYVLPSTIDLGDAPDTSGGAAAGNYQTIISDFGPSHNIVSTIRLGGTIDGENDGQPTATADGDDTEGLTPDDENGLANAAADLTLTELQAPEIDVIVSNNTGQIATLYGWIDYNGNGNFEVTERGSITVPSGTIAQTLVLPMPTVTLGSFAALAGNTTYARFRLSTDSDAQQPTGTAHDGEVEDYAGVTIAAATSPDYGDAPDDGSGAANGPGDYNTLLATGGPSHAVVNNLYLGMSVDGESDGQPHANLLGDDSDENDDDDGLADISELVLIHGQTPVVNVTVTNHSGQTATIIGWIDYNANGIFEAGESAAATFGDGSTSAVVTLTFPVVPAGYVGFTAARFRISTSAAAIASPVGAAPDGEVEDYQAYLSDVAVFDFGDAPDTGSGAGAGNYNTAESDQGPRHALQTPIPQIYFGGDVDAEFDTVQPSNSSSDDTIGSPDDEDGIASPDTELALLFGQSPLVRIHAVNETIATAYLYGWIDYDGDGVFETSEQSQATVPSGTNGTIALAFPAVPFSAAANTYARFRISSLEAAVKDRPTGGAPDGEVEDYAVTITSAVPDHVGVYRPTNTFFFRDFNDDGTLDGDDAFGALDDAPLIGDWNGDGTDEIGVYRPASGEFFLDVNGNGIWDGSPVDKSFSFGALNDVPIVGDWDGDGDDEAGVFRPATATFYRDLNGNGIWNGAPIDSAISFGAAGDTPIVGDWDGDGDDDLGVYRGGAATFFLDVSGNGIWNGAPADRMFAFGAINDAPIRGDWDGDSDDEIGVYRPSSSTFFRDLNGNGTWDGAAVDSSLIFGINGDKPTVGKWAVPLLAARGPIESAPKATTITSTNLSPMLDAAIDIWAGAGLSAAELAALRQVGIQIADLAGAQLGVTGAGTIVIDVNAAGHGWFVDVSPRENEEFTIVGPPGLIAAGDSAASGQMDLLTVLLHELGHILGWPDADSTHDPDALMNARLDVGLRRLPDAPLAFVPH